MKRLAVLTLIIFLGIGVSAWAQEKRKPKVPHAGGNVTPREAHEMLRRDPRHTFLIDVRSMAEYEFIGHPPTAHNIPYKFWSPEGLKKNPNFVKDVEEKFKKTDRLLLICRSGKRSCYASDILVKAGFKRVFNVLDGFEGDTVKDKKSANYGRRRLLNGWQHAGLPYTYKLERKFRYKLHTSCGCD